MTGRELDEYFANAEKTVMAAQSLGVQVQHRGGTKVYQMCCPGHLQRLGKVDKNPNSCKIMPNGGYHCFACGVSKTTRQMIQEIRNCSAREAYEYMAGLIGTTYNKQNLRDDPSFPPAWLSYDEADVIGLHTPVHVISEDDVSLINLYKKDKQAYYELIIEQAKAMLEKYKECKNYSAPNAPKAYALCEMLGDKFDVTVYGKLDTIINERIEMCDKIIKIFSGCAKKEKIAI